MITRRKNAYKLSFANRLHNDTHLYGERVMLWIYRIMVPLGGYRSFIEPVELSSESMAKGLGMEHWLDHDEYDPKGAIKELRARHRQAERELKDATLIPDLEANVCQLGDLLGLDAASRKILSLTMLTHECTLLDEASEMLGSLSNTRLYEVLSTLLELPAEEIKQALSPHGKLARTGLMVVEPENLASGLSNKLETLSSTLSSNMLSSGHDPMQLLRETIRTCSPPVLQLSNFAHMEQSLQIVLPYLEQAIHEARRGVNIFIHGQTGTGKSQIVRLLAKSLGVELYEVARDDDDGNLVPGNKRLKALRMAQEIMRDTPAMILFDEVEDVFGDDGFMQPRSVAQAHKGWMNQLLEENPSPTIWITNVVDSVDPAFIRRFDVVIEMANPGKQRRLEIIQAINQDLLPAELVERLATNDALTPAVFERATNVVGSIQARLASDEVPKAVEHLLNATLQAQGYGRLKRHDPTALPRWYNPALINCSTDLRALADGLLVNKAGRICLYGPPGTGKTAFGRWLADHLQQPLMVKRASDLIDKYVGQTERNIAKAFAQAETEGALLLIDEVDGFLQERSHATRSWEVTAVNEMLTQMESFAGLFIASTNLMEGLDQASLRRFDLKLHFDYLRPEQAWSMFCQQIADLGLKAPSGKLKSAIGALDNLTPGDLAAVARAHTFRPYTDPQAVYDALQEACQLKHDGKQRRIGFV